MRKSQYLTIIIVIISVAMILGAIGHFVLGNKQIIDFNQKFEYAYVCWPDGTSEKLKIKSWKDYDGEQIQITTARGTYLFHSANCVLAHE